MEAERPEQIELINERQFDDIHSQEITEEIEHINK